MPLIGLFFLWIAACWLALASWLLAALCAKLPATLPGAVGVRRILRGMALVLYVPGLLYSAGLALSFLNFMPDDKRWTDGLAALLLMQSPAVLPLLACTVLFWRFWRKRRAELKSAT